MRQKPYRFKFKALTDTTTPAYREGNRFAVYAARTFGNASGFGCPVVDWRQALDVWRTMVVRWKRDTEWQRCHVGPSAVDFEDATGQHGKWELFIALQPSRQTLDAGTSAEYTEEPFIPPAMPGRPEPGAQALMFGGTVAHTPSHRGKYVTASMDDYQRLQQMKAAEGDAA